MFNSPADAMELMSIIDDLADKIMKLVDIQNKILDRVEEIEKRLNGHIVKSGGF